MLSKNRKSKKIILTVTSDLVTDQRIHKIAKTLHDLGYIVFVIGRKKKHSLNIINRPYSFYRMNLFFEKGKLFYIEYNIRLFFILLFLKYDVITSNDLDTLLASFLASKIRNKEIVYDTHEYFTEVPELVHRKTVRKIWLTLERCIFPKLKHVSTVNQSIADVYRKEYHIDVKVIRNLPYYEEMPISDEPKKNILLYQGAVNLGRGIELLISTLPFIEDAELWIVGSGDVIDQVKSLTKRLNIEKRVKFFGLVPFEQLKTITKEAKIGFSLEEDMGLNYRYASPNKVYDYIQFHVPVVVSNLPEMAKLVDNYQVGEILTERTEKALSLLVTKLLNDSELYTHYVRQCSLAAQELCWEFEEEKVKQLYELE